MAELNPRNMSYLRSMDARLHEALSDMVKAINSVGVQANAEPTGLSTSPQSIGALHVVAGRGVFDARITDLSPVSRGLEYQLEYSTSSTFASSHLVHLGPSRNWRGMLGQQQLYFRAHSTYPTSPPSTAVHHGGVIPVMVDGTAPTEPGLQPGAGSGTGTLTQTGQGYGANPFRSSTGFMPVKS